MPELSAHMRSVTNGLSTGGSLALAYKLLSWADKQPLQLPIEAGWHFDALSCLVGLFLGVVLVLVVEAWVTARLAFNTWLQQLFNTSVSVPKTTARPYKLC